MQVNLCWLGPYSLKSESANSLLKCPAAGRTGIYVWAVETSEGWLAYYVGETGDSFARRHSGHLQRYRTGSYSIHRAELLRTGCMDAVFQGYVYSTQKKPAKTAEYQERQAKLQQELAACFEAIQVFVADLDGDRRTRRRIETAMLDLILASHGGLRGFEAEKWSRWPRLATEEPIQVRSMGLPLRGIPETFSA